MSVLGFGAVLRRRGLTEYFPTLEPVLTPLVAVVGAAAIAYGIWASRRLNGGREAVNSEERFPAWAFFAAALVSSVVVVAGLFPVIRGRGFFVNFLVQAPWLLAGVFLLIRNGGWWQQRCWRVGQRWPIPSVLLESSVFFGLVPIAMLLGLAVFRPLLGEKLMLPIGSSRRTLLKIGLAS